MIPYVTSVDTNKKGKFFENRESDSRVTSEHSRLQISKKKERKGKERETKWGGRERAKLLLSFVNRCQMGRKRCNGHGVYSVSHMKCKVNFSLEEEFTTLQSCTVYILYLIHGERGFRDRPTATGSFPITIPVFYLLVYALFQLTAHSMRSDCCFLGFREAVWILPL